MFTEDLKQIKAIANAVGFKRAGDGNGYLAWVKEEAAKEQEKINAIVSETNKTLRELEAKKRAVAVQKERRRLQIKSSPEMHTQCGIPRVGSEAVNGMTEDEVTIAIKSAVATFKSRIDISKTDFTFLTNVMSVNEVDPRLPENWELVLDWCIQRLTLIETGGPIPNSVEAPQVKPEDVNPYSFSSHPQSAYAQWQKQHLQDQNYAEVMPVVRAALEEIVSYDSKDLLPESIEHLIKVMTNKQRPFVRSEVRKTFLEIWGRECSQEMLDAAFTPQEIRDYRNDVEDRHLSSEQIKAKYVYGHRS